jgi:hypothetical protein
MDAYGPKVERQMRRLFNSLGEKDEKRRKRTGNGSPSPSLDLPQMCYCIPSQDRVVIYVDWTMPPDPSHHTINGH